MANIDKETILNTITDVNDSDVRAVKAISVIPLPTHVKDRADELKQRMVQVVTEYEKGQGAFGVINKKLGQIRKTIGNFIEANNDYLSSYQRNVPLEGTPFLIGTKIVDDRVFIKASSKDKQGVTLGIIGDNITFVGDDDLTDARNLPSSATSYHSKTYEFGIYDDGERNPQQTNTSYFVINGYKWDDARNTWTFDELFKVNNVNDFITMHPKTFYAEAEKFEVYGYDGDAYIPTTDHSVVTKRFFDDFEEKWTSQRIGLLSVGEYDSSTGIIEFVYDDEKIVDFEYDESTGILTIEY